MKSDKTRFLEALAQSQEALRGYCYAAVASWMDAEDILQATNIKLWEKEAEWDRDRPFLPWALGTAKYAVLSHFRDMQREKLLFEADVAPLMEDYLSAQAEKTPELTLSLRNCLSKLPQKDREPLKAHYVEGWTLEEISRATGRSVSGVKSLLFRLRQKLAECLEKEAQL